MAKFWGGFVIGIPIGLAFILAFIAGLALGLYSHPYEQCTRKGFTNPEDIGECIWLLDNQPALR